MVRGNGRVVVDDGLIHVKNMKIFDETLGEDEKKCNFLGGVKETG